MNQNTTNRMTPAPINAKASEGTDADASVESLMCSMLAHAKDLNPDVLQFIDPARGLAIQWPKDVGPCDYGHGADAKDEPIGPTILSVCEPWEDMRCILASQYDPRAFEPYRKNPGQWSHRHLGYRHAGNMGAPGPFAVFYPTVLRPTGLLATYVSRIRTTEGNHLASMIMHDAVLDYVTGVESPREITIVGDVLQTKWHAMVQAERQHRVDNYRHAEPIDHQSDSWGFEGMG